MNFRKAGLFFTKIWKWTYNYDTYIIKKICFTFANWKNHFANILFLRIPLEFEIVLNREGFFSSNKLYKAELVGCLCKTVLNKVESRNFYLNLLKWKYIFIFLLFLLCLLLLLLFCCCCFEINTLTKLLFFIRISFWIGENFITKSWIGQFILEKIANWLLEFW